MFWIVDSILMKKRSANADKMPSVHYHKSDAKYNKLKLEESCSDSEVIVHTQPTKAS